MHNLLHRLRAELDKRQITGNLRSLRISTGMIDFSSNDYLGLSRSETLSANIEEAWLIYRATASNGKLNGATGSRLLSGNSELAEEVESELAKWLKAEAVLIFPTGFQANLALISCLPSKKDLILYDELVHASMREGYRLAFCAHRSFRHNDLLHLENRLQQARKSNIEHIFVLAESIYSMDGDAAPLAAMMGICQKHNANLIWDEAHSTGLFSPSGNGIACQMGMATDIFARVYTFGKAPGIHGACIAGSKTLINYLVNFSRGFIYSTAISPHSLITLRESVKLLQRSEAKQRQLQNNIVLFQKLVASLLPDLRLSKSQSAIQAVIIPGNEECKKAALHLQHKGLDVRPVLSPTVQAGTERLRIILHAFNTTEEIQLLVNSLGEL